MKGRERVPANVRGGKEENKLIWRVGLGRVGAITHLNYIPCDTKHGIQQKVIEINSSLSSDFDNLPVTLAPNVSGWVQVNLTTAPI